MIDFAYLKNWIDFPTPRPVILECESSTSGMSLGVWDRDRKIFTIGGCGFDRVGAAIAHVLQTCWQAELDDSGDGALYGARRDDEGHVYLEGAAGVECMREVGALIGLDIQTFDSHHGAIIHITRKG